VSSAAIDARWRAAASPTAFEQDSAPRDCCGPQSRMNINVEAERNLIGGGRADRP
jgi:hypothetical protein